MKNETIASDITKTLAARDTGRKAQHDTQVVSCAITAGANQHAALERAIASRNASLAAQSDLQRVPAPRRTLAANIIAAAERIAHTVAHNCGGTYSGNTRYITRWGTKASAHTATGQGSRYSRGCTYKRTDAEHVITLDPAGVALLVENEPLRSLSAMDGLRLIALYPDGSAVWVRTKGKAIESEAGWIAWNGSICYHSTKSMEHAKAGFDRKLKAHLKVLREERKSHKENRRARLVARLCAGVTATIEDARRLGYCTPGIQAFQSRYGIGDSATLPELVRTGNPSAVRLALSVARNLKPATV